MGLFDRFKKRFKKSSEDEISADEDSAEAKQASEEGAQMRQDIAKKREAPITPPQIEESDNEWDDDDDIVPDPFAATPTDRLAVHCLFVVFNITKQELFENRID